MAKRAGMSETVERRLEQVRQRMKALRVDGYLVADRKDQYWLTGFTGEVGYVLVTGRQVALLTDGRFIETAKREAQWAKAIIRKKRTIEHTAEHLAKFKVERLAFDPDDLPVSVFAGLRKHLTGTKLVSAAGVIEALRMIKDGWEVEAIRRAIDIAQRAFVKATAERRPEMSERELAARIAYEMGVLGAEEPAFGTNVSAGEAACLPHYEPSAERRLGQESVLIDWGARAGWYVSDLTRVLQGASIPPRLQKVYDTVRAAHDAAVSTVRPGAKSGAVDQAARRVIEKAGFGAAFTHGTGHGIGLDVHEAPGIRKGGDVELRPGMVFTIEPGVYLPGAGGVRIESDVLVTADGHEVLSDLPY